MSMRSPRGPRLRLLAAAFLVAGLGSYGCGSKPTADPVAPEAPTGEAKGAGETRPATQVSAAKPVEPGPIKRDRLHQAFADAVRGPDDPPAGERPADETVTKKPTFRVFEMVKNVWDTIRFTSADGKKIQHTATIETSQGTLVLELFPELAPNHVRNFLALAKVGYYDQLFVERIRHEQNPMTMQELHMLEAGCPLGTGATGSSSIGYWLKEEFTPAEKISHDEGIVGACHGEDADSASTRFYISLNKAPYLDGNYSVFGKVVQGLDVLRKIGQLPVMLDDEGNSKPLSPLVIQKVTVTSREEGSR